MILSGRISCLPCFISEAANVIVTGYVVRRLRGGIGLGKGDYDTGNDVRCRKESDYSRAVPDALAGWIPDSPP